MTEFWIESFFKKMGTQGWNYTKELEKWLAMQRLRLRLGQAQRLVD
jgi:hypothetical protein